MGQYKVIIFGTGKSAEKVYKAIQKEMVEVVNFVDNNYNKHGKLFKKTTIISPDDILGISYDYIIVAIIKYQVVVKQLMGLGVSRDKILPYFDVDIIEKDNIDKIINPNLLLRDYYDMKLYQMMIEYHNKPYEVVEDVERYIPNVKGIHETIEKLIYSDVSISRFGDGEIKLIAGQDIGFQEANPKLTERLKEVLYNKTDKHIVGILNVFGSLSEYTEDLQSYFRSYLYEYDRAFQYSLLNREQTYYDAFITRPYISYRDKSYAGCIFEKFKQVWEHKDVLIVEGERSRLGCGNDLFHNTSSCKRIICPNENAFDYYDEILDSVLKQPKERIVLLALGPTATVLAYDLAKKGYRAIDIGHIDIEYEWYRMGATEKVPVQNKYTNEAYGGNGSLEYKDGNYENQIVMQIGSRMNCE